MTSRVVRGGEGKLPGELSAIIISCDNMGCEVALNDTQIAQSGGLKEMGWSVIPRDGRLHHYCPDHRR